MKLKPMSVARARREVPFNSFKDENFTSTIDELKRELDRLMEGKDR